MDRKPLREFTHKAADFLNIRNNDYKQWVFRYTFLELEKDLGSRGDITTNSIFSGQKNVKGSLVAKANGIFAGKDELRYFLIDADPKFRPGIRGDIIIDLKFEDGQAFKKGDVLLKISGDVHDILAVERVLVNFAMRMSTIASFTNRIIKLVSDYDVLITPTRKTLWGLIDKKACVIGGGGSHRLNMADAILVKDNHVDLINRDYGLLLERIAESGIDTRFLEVEVRDIKDVLACAKAFYAYMGRKLRTIGVLLMDNMSAREISEAVKELRNAKLSENILLEASGGINEQTVVDYARTGVDIISMGCLTMNPPTVDMSLKIEA